MTQIGLKRYRLLFYGNVMAEADPEQARLAMARRYRLSGEKLDTCFSGRKIALHADLAEADAYRIQSELEDLGLITHLDLTGETAAPSPAPAQPIPPMTPHTSQQSRQDAEQLVAAAVADRPPRQINWPLWLGVATVLALVGIGSWMAKPIYQQLQLNQQIRSGLAQGEALEPTLAEFVERTGFWPNSNLDAGLGDEHSFASDELDGIRIGNKSLVVITFKNSLPRIGGDTLLLVPQRHQDGSVSWRCDGGTLAAELLPSECRAPEATAYEIEDKADALTLTDLKNVANAPNGAGSRIGPAPNYVKRIIMDEINSTGHLRKALLEMKMLDTVWPQNNQEAGLPEGRRLGSHAFRRIEVKPEGRIMYEFSSAIQGFEGHKLFLVPTELGKWGCEATFPPEYMPEHCSASI